MGHEVRILLQRSLCVGRRKTVLLFLDVLNERPVCASACHCTCQGGEVSCYRLVCLGLWALRALQSRLYPRKSHGFTGRWTGNLIRHLHVGTGPGLEGGHAKSSHLFAAFFPCFTYGQPSRKGGTIVVMDSNDRRILRCEFEL